MRAFDAATGTPEWSAQLPGQSAFSSPPTASDGVVYTGGAGSSGTVYAVREADGTVLWTQGVAGGDNSSPALSNASVYFSYSCGLVYALNHTTGHLQWFSKGPCQAAGARHPCITPVVSGIPAVSPT